MRVDELIELLPTSYKRSSDLNKLREGHYIPKLGEWTKEDGFVKTQELSYVHNKGTDDEWTETLACPIIAFVETKIGNNDLTLSITAKTSKYKRTNTHTQEGKTLEYDIYEADSTTESSLTIPRFTTPNATFLITGLGNNVYGIDSVSDNVLYDSGKVSFYALASAGSRIIYWMSIWRLTEDLKRIHRPWIAPSKCSRCEGTGVEPGTEAEICEQCKGYKYSGYSAIKHAQKQIGKDLGLRRTLLDRTWDNLTESDHEMIWKFINKCWTQKWWVTPTKSEIKRLFAHFYMVDNDSIYIDERFNMQEPVWELSLPSEGGLYSPFEKLDEEDVELMKYIAKSITPAGVSVFVGFYDIFYFGNFNQLGTGRIFPDTFQSSIEHMYKLWGTSRWDFYNGWTEAIDDFENTGLSGMWNSSGNVSIKNVNDQNRHMCQLSGNAYIEYCGGISKSSGIIEIWSHPQGNDLFFGVHSASGNEFGIEFVDDSGGFLQRIDNTTELIRAAYPHSDFHLRVEWDDSGNLVKTYINRELKGSGSCMIIDSGACVRVETEGSGCGYVDAYGDNWSDPNYEINDNWQRLHKFGWGLHHRNELSGVDNLYSRHFERDRPIMFT